MIINGKPHNDREIMELCLRAFKAIPRADDSRKFLKRELNIEAVAWAGNRSHILAIEMVKLIEAHLKEIPQ